MKRSLVFCLILIASCSAPEGPTVTPSPKIPRVALTDSLALTDTLDFGSLVLGTSKTLTLRFENKGTDTIQITSQSISEASFSFVDTSKRHFALAPDSVKLIAVRYTASDTMAHIAFDTVRAGSVRWIAELRSSGKAFSSMFDSTPSYNSVSLNRLFGVDSNFAVGPNPVFNFSISAGPGVAQPRFQVFGDTMIFYGATNSGVSPFDGDGYSQTENDKVWLHIDANTKTIDWLKAQSTYGKQTWTARHGNEANIMSYSRTEFLAVHGIALTRGTNSWTAKITGSTLKTIVDSARWADDGVLDQFTYQQGTLTSITGYDSTSSLSVIIR